MNEIKCINCGSLELSVNGSIATCMYCKSSFENLASTSDSSIDIQRDIEALLQKCEDDPSNRSKYVNLILDIDPTNPEALKYQ